MRTMASSAVDAPVAMLRVYCSLRSQTVRKERKIDRPDTSIARGCLHREHLIFVHGLRLVQQAADEGTFPVIDAAGRAESQERSHQK